MKKIIMLFCMVVCMFVTSTLAQEVRGVETRLAEYVGDAYKVKVKPSSSSYSYEVTKTEYYGFELTNKNSIPVSVSVEIYERTEKGDKLVATKDVVLKSEESYIMKQPKIEKFYDGNPYCDYTVDELIAKGKEHANYFYVKYKAFKLQ